MNITEDFIPVGRANRPGDKIVAEYITIHDTANPAAYADAEAHAAYLQTSTAASKPVSWHFTVCSRAIVQHLPIDEHGWHSGDGNGTGNLRSIGIEICENADGDRAKAEINAAWLVAYLMRITGLPLDRVVQHNKWSGKNCPHIIRARPNGWAEFLAKVGGGGENVSQITKERYAGTDVYWARFDPAQFRFSFVCEKDAKVSGLVRKHGADFGVNFPFFDAPAKIPIGTVWDGAKYVNGAYGKAQKWHFLAFKNGKPEIRKPGADVTDCDFAFGGTPMLIEPIGGTPNPCWDYYRATEDVSADIVARCQRTFIGIDANGRLIIAVSDGRKANMPGLSLAEMTDFMLAKGAIWALNGDGGGSSVIADKSGVLSQNSGIDERTVHHALLITEKTSANPPAPKLYRVQVGAFGVLANAERLAEELRSKGYATIIKAE